MTLALLKVISSSFRRKRSVSRAFACCAASCAAVYLAFCVSACAVAGSSPEITSISPRLAVEGEVLLIQGKNFGSERGESVVYLANTAPTSSSYLSWSATQIELRIPAFGDSALIRVQVGKRKSKAFLLSNREAIPVATVDLRQSEESSPLAPLIASIEGNESAAAGSLVIIRGSGFGSTRENSGVFFSWAAQHNAIPTGEEAAGFFIEVSEMENGYELWSDRELRVRVPDGAQTGTMQVRTDQGRSRPAPFTLAARTAGSKTFHSKHSFSFSYGVDIRVAEAAAPNALYLWMPLPAAAANQRSIELLARSRAPLIERLGGASVFQFNNLAQGSAASLNVSFVTDVYAVETNLRNQAVRAERSSFVNSLLRPSPLVPSADAAIAALAKNLASGESLAVNKARRIYRALLTRRADAADGKTAWTDSYQAAFLFCALARAQGIPAIPVAGVLIDKERQTHRHAWAEFWLDGLGWVPVDIAAGAAAVPAAFELPPDPAAFYFGSLDGTRVAFSRGESDAVPADSNSRRTARDREYALLPIWEEASGNLEAYSSLWSDITITGMYAQ